MHTSHHFAQNLYAKEARIPANHILVQHKHKYDHFSFLMSGTVELMVDGMKSELTGPCMITIEANKHHGVRSLTDVVWFCVHSTEYVDVDEIDNVLIVPDAPGEMQNIAEAMQ